jgi:hypothetical protein
VASLFSGCDRLYLLYSISCRRIFLVANKKLNAISIGVPRGLTLRWFGQLNADESSRLSTTAQLHR